MKHFVATLVTAAIAFAITSPADAQNKRSFVSGQGNDANPCQLAAPCRSFARAIAVTNAGGEISILDVAGYGPVTIDKAISIVNDGVGEAGITFNGAGTGITINAGANDAVYLRGLTIEGGGINGTTGIQFNSGASLSIENCVIRHLAGVAPGGYGIDFAPSATSRLSISNSTVSDNVLGIAIVPSGAGTVTASLSRLAVNDNESDGIFVNGDYSTGTVDAVVYDSVVSGTGAAALEVAGNSGFAPAALSVIHSVSANNGFGLYATGDNALLRVGQSAVIGNYDGWFVAQSGVVNSYGDNYIDGNTQNEAAPPSIPRK